MLGTKVAKAAVDAVVRSLALELGPHGDRVNAVAPGLVLTDASARIPRQQKDAVADRTPLRRNAAPADVAGAILLLAAGSADFITGAYVPVNGGSHMF